jgi:hypothetical protein
LVGQLGGREERTVAARDLGDGKGERLGDDVGRSGARQVPPLLVSLQRSAGNRAVSGLVQRWREGSGEAGVVRGVSHGRSGYANLGGLVQRWPSPEVTNQPEKSEFRTYKCHDAVVFWVLLSLPMSPAEARDALNLMQQKRGPSSKWIVEALNYGSNTRVSSPPQVVVGDILFTGATSYVAHTMVVIDANNVVGFNNFGTFGTDGGGDQYSTEMFANPKYWHQVDGQWQIGTGSDASFPIYKVSFATAQASLRNFLARLRTEADYELPQVDVGDETEIGETAKATKKKGCFITTAVALRRGLPDDCEELTTLRAFRDTYVARRPDGPQLIDEYYECSPLIVSAIARQSDPGSIYQQLYDVIRSCVDAVNRDDHQFAFTTYCDMVHRLKVQYLPED